MTNVSENKRIGFWYSLMEPDLPNPVVSKNKNEHSIEFINKCNEWINLNKTIKTYQVELMKLGANLYDKQYVSYMGSSKCRICGIMNGDAEYNWNQFVFPEGIFHYIVEHWIQIDDHFKDMITENPVLNYRLLKIETREERILKFCQGMNALKFS